jgi:hypothetical protein
VAGAARRAHRASLTASHTASRTRFSTSEELLTVVQPHTRALTASVPSAGSSRAQSAADLRRGAAWAGGRAGAQQQELLLPEGSLRATWGPSKLLHALTPGGGSPTGQHGSSSCCYSMLASSLPHTSSSSSNPGARLLHDPACTAPTHPPDKVVNGVAGSALRVQRRVRQQHQHADCAAQPQAGLVAGSEVGCAEGDAGLADLHAARLWHVSLQLLRHALLQAGVARHVVLLAAALLLLPGMLLGLLLLLLLLLGLLLPRRRPALAAPAGRPSAPSAAAAAAAPAGAL